jgi:hypothetical protein
MGGRGRFFHHGGVLLVTESIWAIAVSTSVRLAAWSLEVRAIPATSRSISTTRSTMVCKVESVWRTMRTPASTCTPDWLIRALISLAASAERWARARTSEATTAKPFPASPALAASTPAFSARRLVWKAISSIMPTIWEMWPDDSSMAPIACTAPLTTVLD